jgi:hypothetical protein
MQHFKEGLIIGAFIFLFYQSLDKITKYNRILSKTPEWIIALISALSALAIVKLFLLNGIALQ